MEEVKVQMESGRRKSWRMSRTLLNSDDLAFGPEFQVYAINWGKGAVLGQSAGKTGLKQIYS